jgi:hypothetical protein
VTGLYTICIQKLIITKCHLSGLLVSGRGSGALFAVIAPASASTTPVSAPAPRSGYRARGPHLPKAHFCVPHASRVPSSQCASA